MANDPAFLFYPGDYLRDTQILSESVQVAYDRIMCEHMRNICISQRQLKFITKRLTSDEVEELMHVLTRVEGGFQIHWVAESINKRRAYSESRRKNRTSKKREDMFNISKTYDSHMENENENENEVVNGSVIYPFDGEKFVSAWMNWKRYKKEQHNFTYKSPSTEQGALTLLTKCANSADEAVEVIMQSIGRGWKGFVKIKRDGQTTNQSSAATAVANLLRKEGLAQ